MIALLAAARAIHFVSLMTIFGGCTYAALLQRAELCGPAVKPAYIVFVSAATLALVSGIAWFCLIAGQMSGNWRGSLDPSILQLAASGTRFGKIFLGRIVGLTALWVLCAFRKESGSLGISILAGLLLASLAPVSHAAASGSDIAIIGAANDAVHLLTGGFWLGGLMVLALYVARHWGNSAALLGALRLFSIWGSVAVALLVTTGVINAASILPLHRMSIHNPYFDLLLVKVGFASTMVGLAAMNRWHFAPRLRTDQDRAARYLAVSISIEIVLGFTVVGIAGYLGLMAPH